MLSPVMEILLGMSQFTNYKKWLTININDINKGFNWLFTIEDAWEQANEQG